MPRADPDSRYRINLDEAERKILKWAIKSMVNVVGDAPDGWQLVTAGFLGISPSHLRNRIKALNIDVAEVLTQIGAEQSAERAKKHKAVDRRRKAPESEYDGGSEEEETNEEDEESGFENDEGEDEEIDEDDNDEEAEWE